MKSPRVFLTAALVAFSVPALASAAPLPAVSMRDAPSALPSFTYPSCEKVEEAGLPSRSDFTRAASPAEPAPASSEHWSATDIRDILVKRSRDFPQKGLHVERKTGTNATTWWRFGYWTYGETAPSLLDMTAQYRTELGFSSGETAVLVGDRVYKSYPNGAVSVGYLRRVPVREPDPCPPQLGCCFSVKPSRGPGFMSTLPGPGDALGDAPAVNEREALATVHDMNPYVAFVPIDDTGPQRAARLVVVSTRTQASSLAWEVRYGFSCIETRANRRGPKIRRNVAYAYVDARSGALVFGRDPLRLGGAVDQDY